MSIWAWFHICRNLCVRQWEERLVVHHEALPELRIAHNERQAVFGAPLARDGDPRLHRDILRQRLRRPALAANSILIREVNSLQSTLLA